jgi:hypothetical protein
VAHANNESIHIAPSASNVPRRFALLPFVIHFPFLLSVFPSSASHMFSSAFLGFHVSICDHDFLSSLSLLFSISFSLIFFLFSNLAVSLSWILPSLFLPLLSLFLYSFLPM